MSAFSDDDARERLTPELVLVGSELARADCADGRNGEPPADEPVSPELVLVCPELARLARTSVPKGADIEVEPVVANAASPLAPGEEERLPATAEKRRVPHPLDYLAASSELERAQPGSPMRQRAATLMLRFIFGLALLALFFLGALSAGAGDQVIHLITTSLGSSETGEAGPSSEPASTRDDPTTTDASKATDATSSLTAPETTSMEATSETTSTAQQPAAGPPPAATGTHAEPAGGHEETLPAESTAPAESSATAPTEAPTAPDKRTPPPLDPEVSQPLTSATVWLNRSLPDPIPPAQRLKRAFARNLEAEARRAGVDWALILAVLRARGQDGPAPARPRELRVLARRLASLGARPHPRAALLALSGRNEFAERTFALAAYYRAVGLDALVTGLEAAKDNLAARVLGNGRIDIYAGGREDIASGQIDVRVLALTLYLAEMHGQVTVSSLRTGHRFWARPGAVSAHVYGLAVDIAGLGGRPIAGNQEPGGLTERAVRNILLLPSELQPQQVISLLALGGPSFALADHYDHIHVGYAPSAAKPTIGAPEPIVETTSSTPPANTAPPTVSGAAREGEKLTATATSAATTPVPAVSLPADPVSSSLSESASRTSTTTRSFLPSADAYVSAARPRHNFGSSRTLHVGAGPVRRAYLRFDLRSLTGTVSRATLRLYAVSGSGDGYAVRLARSNRWGEHSLNYVNAPRFSRAWHRSGSFRAGTWTSVDVTGLVTAGGTLSLALTSPERGRVRLGSSKYGGHRPRLVIQPDEPAPPPTPPTNTALPTISGTAREGEQLTATSGSWAGTTPIAYAYRWRRCDAAGAGCTPILGATEASDTLTAADAGSTMRVEVTATNAAGTATATSTATALVAAAAVDPGSASPPASASGCTGNVIDVYSGGDIAASASAASPGDTIRVHAGTYPKQMLAKAFSAKTCVEAAPGESVIVRGFDLSSAANLDVSGFTVAADSPNWGFRFSSGAHGITVHDNRIHGGDYGIKFYEPTGTWPSNIAVRDNDIWGAVLDNVHVDGAKSIVLQHNYIHDVDLVTNTQEHHDGIQVISGDDILIERNTISLTNPPGTDGPNQGIIVGHRDPLPSTRRVSNVVIASNLVHHWAGIGILLAGVDGAKIVNNTVYDNGAGNSRTNQFLMSSKNDAGDYQNNAIEVWNNIFGKMWRGEGSAAPGYCGYNLIWPSSSNGCDTVGELAVDPSFADHNSYRLQFASPALESGSSRAGTPVYDLDGLPYGAPDRGARTG